MSQYPTQPYSAPRTHASPLDPDLVRDLAAVLLMGLGGIGLVVIAFMVDTLLGAAALSALATIAGAALGYRR